MAQNADTSMNTAREDSSDDLDLESLPSMDDVDEHDEEEVVAVSDEDKHQDKSVDFCVSDDDEEVDAKIEIETVEHNEEEEDDAQKVRKHEDEVRARRRDLARRRAVLDLMRSESAARVHRSLERKKQREKDAAVSSDDTAQDADTKSANGEDDAKVGSNEKQSSETHVGVPVAVTDKTANVADSSGTKAEHARGDPKVPQEVSQEAPQKTTSEDTKKNEEKPAAQDVDKSDDDEPKSLFEKHAWLKALVPVLVVLTILVILLVLFV